MSGPLLDAAPGSTATVEVHRVEMEEVPLDGPATLIVHCEDRTTHAPMANMSLSVFETGPGVHMAVRTAKTAEDGSAELSLAAGPEFNLVASRADENTSPVDRRIGRVVPGERRELTFEIATGLDLHWFGRVLARADRSPIPGARLTLASESGRDVLLSKPGEPGSAVVTPGEDGRFELWFRSWKQDFVRVEAAGYGRAYVEVGEGHESPETAKLVLLSKSARIRARLLDARGSPVLAGSVRLEANNHELSISDGDLDDPMEETSSWEGEADASGICSVDDLPPNVPLSVKLFVDKSKLRQNMPQLSLHPGETREVVWRIGGGCDLEGRALDPAGNPVPNCTIWLAIAEISQPTYFGTDPQDLVIQSILNTDTEGRFDFHDVSPGSWWIGPAATRGQLEGSKPGALAALAQVVEVPEGSKTLHVDLHVSPGLYIQGKVLDAAGKPASQIEVLADTPIIAYVPEARTGEDGTFVVGPLAPGRYSLVAERSWMNKSNRVEAAAGEEGIVLQLPERGILTGSVVDAKTGKACRAVVTIALHGPTNPFDLGLGMMQTEQDGTFQEEDLGAGVYSMAARACGGRVGVLKSIVVRPGAEAADVVITVSPGATLRLLNADDRQRKIFTVLSGGVCICAYPLPAGGTAEAQVPAGHIVIQWGAGRGAVRKKERRVSVGEEREVVLGGDH